MCVYSWRNSWVLPPTLLCHLSVRFSLLLSCTITSMICCTLWYKVRDNTVHKMSLSTMFSLLMAVVWSQVGGDKQLLGTGLCIFRVPRLLPEWCHQCCRMANCDEMQRPLHVRPFLGEVLCVLLCLYISQSLNPLKFCCISHTHKCEWLLPQLPISVLLKQSNLCCSLISLWKKRWALATVSADSISWPDLGTTQTSLLV